MVTFHVSLTSIEDLKRFAGAANRCPCEVDVVSGRYIINAKSIMGLFSLDLSKPVQVEVHGNEEKSATFRSEVAFCETASTQA